MVCYRCSNVVDVYFDVWIGYLLVVIVEMFFFCVVDLVDCVWLGEEVVDYLCFGVFVVIDVWIVLFGVVLCVYVWCYVVCNDVDVVIFFVFGDMVNVG